MSEKLFVEFGRITKNEKEIKRLFRYHCVCNKDTKQDFFNLSGKFSEHKSPSPCKAGNIVVDLKDCNNIYETATISSDYFFQVKKNLNIKKQPKKRRG